MNFRPKLSLLRNEDVERIIFSAYDVLATTGVKIRHEEAQILNTYKAPAIDRHTLDEMKRILTEYAEKKGEEIPEFIFSY